MWVITHVMAGLGIAALLGEPWWLILAAVLVAHVLMDLVPHWDYTTSRRQVLWGVLDFSSSLAVFLACWLLLGWPFWLALMGLVSGAPDWDVVISLARGPHARKFFPSHWDSFPHGKSGPVWGVGVQVAVMAASVVLILAAGP